MAIGRVYLSIRLSPRQGRDVFRNANPSETRPVRDEIFISNAFAVVVFPTSQIPASPEQVGILLLPQSISNTLHLTCASLFFLSLAFISIFLFTRTGQAGPTPEKLKRNRVYVISSIVMAVSIVLMVVYERFLEGFVVSRMDPVLMLEAVALVAFGVSWLVKGDTLFKDLPTDN